MDSTIMIWTPAENLRPIAFVLVSHREGCVAAGRLGRVTPASALHTDTWHWTPASPVHSGKQWGQIALSASVYLLHMLRLRGHLLTLSPYPPFFSHSAASVVQRSYFLSSVILFIFNLRPSTWANHQANVCHSDQFQAQKSRNVLGSQQLCSNDCRIAGDERTPELGRSLTAAPRRNKAARSTKWLRENASGKLV